jgi:CheY-like chemotaxis protein
MYDILLIDDLCKSIIYQLEKAPGSEKFKFVGADTIESGLSILKSYSSLYEAVILDIHYPESDIPGIDALKIIREQHSNLPVIIFTSDDQSAYQMQEAVESLQHGAFNYIGKGTLNPQHLFANLLNSIHLSQDRLLNDTRQKLNVKESNASDVCIIKEDLVDQEKYFRIFGYELQFVKCSSDIDKNQKYIHDAYIWQERFLEFVSKTYNNRVRIRLRFKHEPGDSISILLGFKLIEFTIQEAESLLSMLLFDIHYLLNEDKNSPYIFEPLNEKELALLWNFNQEFKYVKYFQKPSVLKDGCIKVIDDIASIDDGDVILPPTPIELRRETLSVLLDAMHTFSKPCEITMSLFPSSLRREESEVISSLSNLEKQNEIGLQSDISAEDHAYYKKVIEQQYSGILIYIVAGTKDKRYLNTLHSLIGQTFYGNKEHVSIVPLNKPPEDIYSIDENEREGRAAFYYLLKEAFYKFRLPANSQKNSHAIPFALDNYLFVPKQLKTSGLLLGNKQLANKNQEIYLDGEALKRHAYILGQTGTGKSTLLKSMILDAAQKGEGFCVLDPHGDLFEDVYQQLPDHRKKDIVLFDMTNLAQSKKLNILECDKGNEAQLNTLIQDLGEILEGNYDMKHQGGTQFDMFFRAAILLAHHEHTIRLKGNPTLEIVEKIIESDQFRENLLNNISDENIKKIFRRVSEFSGDHSWANYVPYINSKLSFFTDNYYLNELFNAKKSTLDFREIMDKKKILLVRLDKGLIGRKNLSLVGRIFMSKMLMAVMSRSNIKRENRVPFYIFIDEFQNFIHNEIADAMAEVRKYNVSLIMANQNISQLGKSMAESVLGNVGSTIFFRPGVMDYELIQNFVEPYFSKEDILRLPNFHCVSRLLVDNIPCEPFVFQNIYE